MRRVILLWTSVVALWTAVPAGRAQPACDEPPLAIEDVEFYLKNFLPFLRLRQKIEACGVTFILDEPGEKRLRNAGGNEELVRLLAPPSTPRPGDAFTPRTDTRPMIWIPAGEFRLGSPSAEQPRDADEALHTVAISGFWMDQHEVTNEAFRRFLIGNPRWQKGRLDAALADARYLSEWNGLEYPAGAGERPVVSVSWHAAAAYAAWAGKRLPTEAEWEYAARAGTTTKYWWGDEFDGGRANNGASLIAVGSGPTRNGWNLFDVLGNASEWTSTVYQPYPYRRDDGREAPQAPERRVVRGGAWNQSAGFLRVANRNSAPPDATSDQLGFRCAR